MELGIKSNRNRVKPTSNKILNLQRENRKLTNERKHAQNTLDGMSKDHECLAIHGDLKHEVTNYEMGDRTSECSGNTKSCEKKIYILSSITKRGVFKRLKVDGLLYLDSTTS